MSGYTSFHRSDFKLALDALSDLDISDADVISVEVYNGAIVNLGTVDSETWRQLCARATPERNTTSGTDRWAKFRIGRVSICAVNPRPWDVPELVSPQPAAEEGK